MYFREITAAYSEKNTKSEGLNQYWTNIQEDYRPILAYFMK
jgi:hypothetical protein